MKRFFSTLSKKTDKPAQISFSNRAFRALDTNSKGYLTKEELLRPIQYQGVETHGALQSLIHKVKTTNDYQFDAREFETMTTQYEFYKKVLSFDLVVPDFSRFHN